MIGVVLVTGFSGIKEGHLGWDGTSSSSSRSQAIAINSQLRLCDLRMKKCGFNRTTIIGRSCFYWTIMIIQQLFLLCFELVKTRRTSE